MSSSQTGERTMDYYWAYLPNAPVCDNPVNIKAAGISLQTESPLKSILRSCRRSKENPGWLAMCNLEKCIGVVLLDTLRDQD